MEEKRERFLRGRLNDDSGSINCRATTRRGFHNIDILYVYLYTIEKQKYKKIPPRAIVVARVQCTRCTRRGDYYTVRRRFHRRTLTTSGLRSVNTLVEHKTVPVKAFITNGILMSRT